MYPCILLITTVVVVEGLDDGVGGVDLQDLAALHVLGSSRVC